MANIKLDKDPNKLIKCLVIPRNQETYNEKFAVANGRRLPFEVPVMIKREDIDVLEHQKEPFKADSTMSVFDIMEKHSVPQDKAIQIMDAQRHHPELNESTIKWRPKYIVQTV